ncbi:methyltransferase domain-containing protein [Massilia antarctica]|uniref:methyltransferase domain-containing protein n=1 Tax=Massilia antarctica TaxID=2765360 RepID=UPI0035A5892D
MARHGAKVAGIDLVEKPSQIARWHAQDQGGDMRYVCGSAQAWAADHAGRYDVVTCMEMLEDVPQPSFIRRTAATAPPWPPSRPASSTHGRRRESP